MERAQQPFADGNVDRKAAKGLRPRCMSGREDGIELTLRVIAGMPKGSSTALAGASGASLDATLMREEMECKRIAPGPSNVSSVTHNMTCP